MPIFPLNMVKARADAINQKNPYSYYNDSDPDISDSDIDAYRQYMSSQNRGTRPMVLPDSDDAPDFSNPKEVEIYLNKYAEIIDGIEEQIQQDKMARYEAEMQEQRRQHQLKIQKIRQEQLARGPPSHGGSYPPDPHPFMPSQREYDPFESTDYNPYCATYRPVWMSDSEDSDFECDICGEDCETGQAWRRHYNDCLYEARMEKQHEKEENEIVEVMTRMAQTLNINTKGFGSAPTCIEIDANTFRSGWKDDNKRDIDLKQRQISK